MGQRTFETRSLCLILAEKLLTLPAANEMLPLSALFAGKYREVGQGGGIPGLSWRIRFEPDPIVHRVAEPLFASAVSLGRLPGDVSQ